MKGFDPHGKYYWSTLSDFSSDDLTPLALSRRILPIEVYFSSTSTSFTFKIPGDWHFDACRDGETRKFLHEIALMNILELQPLLEKMEGFVSIEWNEECSLYVIEWNSFGTLVYDALPYIGVLAKIESHLENKRNKTQEDGRSNV